jgi:hypothetical protein
MLKSESNTNNLPGSHDGGSLLANCWRGQRPRQISKTLRSTPEKLNLARSIALIRRGVRANATGINMTRKKLEPIKYNGQISFRTTTPMVSAVASAASDHMCSINAWLRDAVLQKLASEGRALPTDREAT